MKNLLIVFSVISCFGSGMTQVSFPRPCPDHPVHTGFTPAQYAGQWYEVMRYDTGTQTAGDCVVSTYSLFTNMIFNTVYSMVINIQTAPFPMSLAGHSYVSFPEIEPLPARMNLTFSQTPVLSNYWILATNYNDYSIVWYCDTITPTSSTETAWVLSRSPSLNPAVQSVVDSFIDQFLDRNYLYNTIQGAACP